MRSTERVELAGGLGNQLFQFTAGIARAVHTNRPIRFDVSRISHGVTSRNESIADFIKVVPVDGVNYSFVDSRVPRFYDVLTHRVPIVRRIDKQLRPSYVATNTGYDSNIFEHAQVSIIRGYFQSWKYLDNLRSRGFRIEVQFENASELINKYSKLIDFENDIALHVRRGDYSTFRETIGLLSSDYFRRAIQTLGGDRSVVIFSDDKDVEKEFSEFGKFLYSPELSQIHSVNSLLLMQQFKNIVISNSTFSWWAGVLGRGDKNVVSPDKWFRALDDPLDLLPMNWKTIKSEWLT